MDDRYAPAVDVVPEAVTAGLYFCQSEIAEASASVARIGQPHADGPDVARARGRPATSAPNGPIAICPMYLDCPHPALLIDLQF